mgnify:FL=1
MGKMALNDLMELYDSNLSLTISDLSNISGLPKHIIKRALLSEPEQFLIAKRKLKRIK